MAFNAHMANADSGREASEKERRDFVTGKDSREERLDVLVGRLIGFDKLSSDGSFIARIELGEGELPPQKLNGRPILGKSFVVSGKSPAFVSDPHSRLGQTLECFGKWDSGQDGKPRFFAGMVNERMPDSPEALEAFLGSGRVKGLGPAWASKLIEKYGARIVEVLDERPDELLDMPGFGEKRLADVKASWSSIGPSRKIIAFARMHGLGDSVAEKMWTTFGEGARRRAEQNPYSLVQLPGVGFKTADKLAKSLGVAPKSPFRIQSCIKHVLDEASKGEGHLALSRDELTGRVCDWLDMDDRRSVEAQIDMARDNGGLVERTLRIKVLRGERWRETVEEVDALCYSTRSAFEAEKDITDDILRLMTSDGGKAGLRREKIESSLDRLEKELDATQRVAARNAFSSSVSVMTGGPGTGKTHTIRTILRAAENAGLTVRMCAPTGRAAQRMEEATGGESSTIHRMLGFAEGGFRHGRANPLEGDLFIVDESSMVDVWLARALLRAIPSGASILFVGDADQLPSVGAGNFLEDIIASKAIAVARLGEIHRQEEGSEIVANAHRVVKNDVPDLSKGFEESDFAFVEAKGPEEISQSIAQIVETLRRNGEKGDNIQILTPKNDGLLGIEGLNSTLRPILNKHCRGGEEGWKICPGDRVMQQKNNYDTDLFNGDVGVVIEMTRDGKSALIDFDGRALWLSGASLRELKPAFAITIHKSQGTEHDIVIIPMTRGHSFMFSSKLLYTAITRAKRKVILVGEKQVVYDVARKAARQFRNTGLKEALRSLAKPAQRSPSFGEPF